MPPQGTPQTSIFDQGPQPTRNKKKNSDSCTDPIFQPCSHTHSKKQSSTLPYASAPSYLKFNPFITGGYRRATGFWGCLKSALTWTNETTNIWTHLVGYIIFLYLMIVEVINWGPDLEGVVVKVGVLLCFQGCMLLSSCYHTFCCSSDASYRKWLTADLFGVSLALLGIYLSGIYFAFKCDEFWLRFYLLTVLVFFALALSAQLTGGDHSCEEGFHWRLMLFGAWSAYGILPTIQWVWMKMQSSESSGTELFWNLVQWGDNNENDVGGGGSGGVDIEVKHLLPRIIKMYTLSGLAFFFYISRLPERLAPGRFNYLCSSHNLWHVLIFGALYYWHSCVVVEHFQDVTGIRQCAGGNIAMS